MPSVGEEIPEEDEDSSSSKIKEDDRDTFDAEDNFGVIGSLNGDRKVGPRTVKTKLQRTISESSSCSSDDIDITPLGLDDIRFEPKDGYASSDEEFSYEPTQSGRFFSAVENLRNRNKKKSESRGLRNWKRALRLIQDRGDPWQKFHLDALKTEKGLRHRYNPLTQQWVTDECTLKMDKKPFANGAMRECFRMKKLSNFSHSADWFRDSNNFVAKRYMEEETDRDTYFQDVKLQMDAKLWGEEFNRHNPPKKVDIFMMAVIELVDRPGRPLYHVEHYIEGNYVKYNSNSGFVDIGLCRQTPQAFSHFTFERSGHNLVVVDIQGVGDLYTDPQIHTAVGEEYGDGNLGTRGMALFFHSHKCNNICQSLGLTPFDLSANEMKSIIKGNSDSITSETRVRLEEVIYCESPPHTDIKKFLRQRSGSWIGAFEEPFRSRNSVSTSECFSGTSSRHNSECEGPHGYESQISVSQMETDEDHEYDYTTHDPDNTNNGDLVLLEEDEEEEEDEEGEGEEKERRRVSFMPSSVQQRLAMRQRGDTETSTDSGIIAHHPPPVRQRRQRGITECMDEWEGQTGDELRAKMDRQSRPSCVTAEIQSLSQVGGGDSILGHIHLDLAIYHETCRFDMDVLDKESALFHLKAAADCGNMQALSAISHLYCGLPNDILPSLTTEDVKELVKGERYVHWTRNREMMDIGLDYMTTASVLGDISSMLYLAKAYDTGLNLGTCRKASKGEAVKWYKEAVEAGADQPYLLQARLAEILLEGGEDCPRNPTEAGELFNSAAESAMEDMKGKLANRYYMLAEEAWAQCEE